MYFVEPVDDDFETAVGNLRSLSEAFGEQRASLSGVFTDNVLDLDLDAVMAELLVDGIDKFVKPFDSLLKSLDGKVKALAPA